MTIHGANRCSRIYNNRDSYLSCNEEMKKPSAYSQLRLQTATAYDGTFQETVSFFSSSAHLLISSIATPFDSNALVGAT